MKILYRAFCLFALVVLLAACGGKTVTTNPAIPTDMPSDMTMQTQYPVTIQDCGGRETTYTKAPERVVTLDPAVTESLLLLGLKDKIVGFTEFQEAGQRWTVTQADMDSLPVINSDMMYPSKEAIIAVTPDLVMSVYPSALLSNPDLPDRDGWTKLGVNSYLTLGECHLSTTPVTDFSALYTDLHNFGIIFNVQERAEVEIAKLKARVDTLQQKVEDAKMEPLTVWSYSGETDPYPAGGVGTPNAIITMAGATNAFADVAKDYDAISWEEIVKRNPDVLWVMTSAGEGMFINELKGIEEKLAADPRLVNITAVKNKAYVVVSYNVGGIETPRNVDALEQMVNGLLALKDTTAMQTQYPITVQDCGGRETTYNKAPERVVTIDPSVTEMLLLLGLKDKIVGYTEFYTTEHQWPATQAEMSSLNQINDINVGYPSQEAVVAVSPDFVTSIYKWAFGYGLPDRDGWTKLGVNSYETFGDCSGETVTDFSALYQDLRNFGIIFDVQERAEVEIAKLQDRVSALQQKVKDAGLTSKRIVIYDGTTEHPPIYGGTINAVINLAGAEYAWANVAPNTTPSWEEFVAVNPDVIWIIPDAGTDVEALKRQIDSDPRLKDLVAVQNKAYIIVPQSDATVESPRIIDGLELVINGLLALK